MKNLYLAFIAILLLCFSNMALAQIIVIDPAGDGGFETGTSFALNGWTAVNPGGGATWQIGTVATGSYTGSRGAFVGTNASTWSYNTGAIRTCHLHRNVTIPAGATNITLSFSLTGQGETNWDRLLVYTGPTTLTLTQNNPASNTTTITGATLQYTQASYYSTPTTQTVSLPNTLAGTSFKLFFTWQNDDLFGTTPPAAIDNISLTYCPQGTATASASPTALCQGSTLSLTGSLSSPTPTSYSWTGPGSYTSTNANNSFAVGTASGVYTFTAFYGSCTYTVATSSVAVTPLPGAISGTTGMCIGGSTTLSCTPTGGTWYSLNTAIATVNASTGQVFGVSAGSATISYATSCGNSTITATVASTPAAIGGSIAPSFALCRSSSTTTNVFTAQGFETPAGSAVPTSTTAVSGWRQLTTPTTNYMTTGSGTGSSPVITGPHGGTYYLKYGAAGVTSQTLCSPSFSLVGVNGAVLRFWQYRDATTGYTSGVYASEGCTILINTSLSLSGATSLGFVPRSASASISGGINGVSTTATDGWQEYSIVLPASFTGATNYLLFSFTSANGQNTYVDDITLTSNTINTTTLTNSVAGGTWASGSTSVATINASTGLLTAVAQGTSLISYTSCASTVTQTVTVNSNPADITGATSSICIGGTATYSNTTTGGTWSSSNIAVASVNAATGVITGIAQGVAVISYSTGCGTVAAKTIAVKGNPDAISPASATICVGTAVTLSNSATGGSWSSSATSVATISAYGVVTGASTGTTTISYSNGCGTAVAATITVNGVPAVTTSTATSLCVGNTATLSNATPAGTWSSSNSTIAQVNASGVVTAISGGVATITYNTTCGTPATTPLTINAAPAAITPLSGVEICTGLTTTLGNTSLSGTWTSSATAVATINATTGVVSGVAQGTTTIMYDNGCGAPATKEITVNAAPNPTISGSAALCQLSTTILSNSISGGTWYSSNTAIATVDAGSGNVGGVTGGTATISYVVTGCAPATRAITVTMVPAAITGSAVLCPSTSTTLADSVTGGTWSSSNTAVATINSTTGALFATATSGTTTISYSNGCAPAATRVVTVSGSPAPIVGTTALCGPSTVTLFTQNFESGIPTTPGTPVAGWNILSGSYNAGLTTNTSYTNPPVSAAQDGSYFLVWHSYEDPYTAGTSATLVSPAFSMVSMAGATVTFWVYRENTDYAGPGYATEGFGIYVNSSASLSGATQLGFVPRPRTRATSGSYITGLSTTSSNNWYQYTCTIPSSYTGGTNYVMVNAVSQYGNNCYLDNISMQGTFRPYSTLTDATPGGTWSSSNTAVLTIGGSTGFVSAVSTGTANISYTAACGSPVVQAITVNPIPGTTTGTTTICQGTSTTWVNSAGSGTWSSSNTAIASVDATTGVITGISGGTATISFSNGCGNAATRNITITATPASITGATNLCPGGSGTLLNTVAGGTWSSSASSIVSVNSSTGLVNAVASSGSATITYSNGCAPAATVTVTISSTPAPITGGLSLCPSITTPIFTQDFETPAGSAVPESTTPVNGWFQLTDVIFGSMYTINASGTGSPSIGAAASGTYFLDFDMYGSNQVLCSPSFNMSPYTSGATLKFWVYRDGAPMGAAYAAEGFTVLINTTASTTGATTLGFVPRRRTGAITGSYITGNSTTASAGWQQYTCTLPASYSGATNYIMFSATSAGGADCYLDNISLTPNTFTTTLTSTTPGGTWSSSATSVATAGSSTGVITAAAAGTTNISYTTACGSVGVVVTVNPTPGVISGSSEVCPGATITLGNAAAGGTWTSSNTAIASVNAATGAVTGIASGSVTITYTTSCGTAATKTITVKDAPSAITGGTSLCPGTTGTLYNSVTGGTWSSSSPSIITVNSSTGVVGAASSSGSSIVSYSNGCSPSASVTVTINNTTAPIVGSSNLCAPTGISTTLLSQNFNSGLTGSIGGTWVVTNLGAVSPYNWAISTAGDFWDTDYGYYGDGSPFIGTNPDAAGETVNINTRLTSPAFSTVGMPAATLSFNHYINSSSTYDTIARIEYSTNGTTWTTLYNYYNTGTSGASSWTVGTPSQNISLPVGALGQPTVYLRWNYNSVFGYRWMLDNVVLSGPQSPNILLTDATPGGTWSSSSTTVATVGATGYVVSVSAGTTTITYAGPCGTPVTQGITVNPNPGTISGGGSVCVGSSLSLSNTAGSGTWTSSNPTVASINASTGVVTGLAAGTATVTFSNGCGTAATSTITVKALPTAIIGATSMCPSTSTVLTNAVTGGTWTSSNTAVATIGTFSGTLNSTATPGTTTITYGNGCSPDVTSVVNVSSTTDTIVGAYNICAAPTSLVYNSFESDVPTSAATPVDGWNYLQGTGAADNYWVSATGSATANPAAGGAPSGGGTKVAQFSSKTISAGNTASLISPAFSLSGGNGGRVSFYFYRDATAGVASNYDSVAVYINTSPVVGGSWIGGVCRSTTRATAYTGTSVAAGWFKYTYTIPASYTGTTNYLIIKGYSAGGNNMYLDSVLIRNNSSSATLTNATSGGTWSTDAPAIATINNAGVVTAISTGTANISYTGACGSPAVRAITINPVPGSNTSGPAVLCVGATTTIANALPSGTWTTSNAAIATVNSSGIITATGTGTATISYATGCGNPATTSITVNALPTVASVTPSATTLCAGATLTLTAGTATGIGSLVSYNWSGPDGYTTTGTATFDAHATASAAATGMYSLSVTYPGLGCVSNPVATSTINVYNYPLAQTVTGGNGCSSGGITVGLAGSESGTTYQLYRDGSSGESITGTGSAISFSAVTTVGAYTVQATGTGGCITGMNGSDTIRQTPSLFIGAVPSICNPLTSVPVAYTTVVGAANSYNIDWDAAANAAGIADVTNASLSGGSINFAIPSSGAVGYFTNTITVSNGYCTSSGYNKNITIYAQPQMTITAVNTPCVGYAGSIDFTGTDSATVNYTIDGGPVNHFTFSGTSYSLSTGTINTPHTYVIQSANNPVCSNTYDSIRVVDPIPMRWIGGAAGHESEWNYAANWSCGFEPGNNDDATIDAATYAPVIPASGSGTTRNVTLTAGATVVINNAGQLNVTGNINNVGSINGQGKVVMNGASAQAISGVGTVNNFELNNSNGATINAAARMMVTNTLYVSSGTLVTNDSLELLSTDTFTPARIAQLPSSGAAISGKVKVDQYIDSGYRRFRFWSHPFRDTISLSQLQNYIDITGPTDTLGGFTHTGSNAPSAFRYDPYRSNSTSGYDSGWRAFTRINNTAADSNKLHPGQGIRLFIRGAKGEGLSYNGYYGLYTPSSAIIKMLGNVNQGNVDVTLAQGSNPANQSYNMVGNPYASPVDIGTILYNAKQAGQITGGAFYVWMPKVAYGGQYMAVPIGSGAPVPYYIQANAAFQVMADHDGAVLHFTESDKSAFVDNYLFKAPSDMVTLNIYDKNYHVWDRLDFQFNNKATAKTDKLLDALKPMGADLNFYAITEDGSKVAIDARPYNDNAIIPLGINSNYTQDFIVRAENVAGVNGGIVTLHDKLLDKHIDMSAGTEYKFTITKDKATQGDNRFELSLKPAANAFKALTATLKPNPASDDVKITFTSGYSEAVKLRVMDVSGVTIYSQDLGNKQSGIVTVPMSNFAAGIYMVEITQGSQKVVQKLVKE